MANENIEAAKNAGDVLAGTLSIGVVLGWVHLAVGAVTLFYTTARFYDWWEKRKIRVKAQEDELRERLYYLNALTEHYQQPCENFDFFPTDELRTQYAEIRPGSFSQ